MAQLPELFIERLHEIIPEEKIDRVMETFSIQKNPTFRYNPLKIDIPTLEEKLKNLPLDFTSIPNLEGIYQIPFGQKPILTDSELFHQGEIYIQNLSSILAAMLLDVKPGETVLDLAAAPGGKSLYLAGQMKNQGQLSCVEAIKDRFFRLKRNLEEQGVSIAQTYLKDGRGVGRVCPAMFDKVMLDAPCSSESRFSTLDEKSFAFWSARKIKEQSKLQKGLILSAYNSLKPGGTMVYCTCSFAPEENEAIVQHLIKKVGDAIEILPIELPIENWMEGIGQWGKHTFTESLQQSRRILPTSIMDGFYICRIKKLR